MDISPLELEIKRLLKKYIPILKLEEWDLDIIVSDKKLIRVENKRIRSTNNIDYFAEVIYQFIQKHASICFTKLQNDNPQELEDTVVHELLHIKFASVMETLDSLVTICSLEQKKTLEVEVGEKEHDLITWLVPVIIEYGRRKNG